LEAHERFERSGGFGLIPIPEDSVGGEMNGTFVGENRGPVRIDELLLFRQILDHSAGQSFPRQRETRSGRVQEFRSAVFEGVVSDK
jgi:hypothetical protein